MGPLPGHRSAQDESREDRGDADGGGRCASEPLLVLFDADLQHTPDEIPRFLERLDEGWDIVTGRKVGSYDKKGGVVRLQPPVTADLRRARVRFELDEGVPGRGARGAVTSARLASLLRGHGACARGASVTEIDVELHPRRAGEAKYGGLREDPHRAHRPGLRLVPAALLAQATAALRGNGPRAGASGAAGHRRHGVPPLRAPDGRLRSVHPAHGLPAAAVPGHAARDAGLPALRLRSGVRTGRPGARRARSVAEEGRLTLAAERVLSTIGRQSRVR